MSFVILKGNQTQRIWSGMAFQRLQQAKEVFLKCHPSEEFKRSDDDLTWTSKKTGTNYHFKEIHDYQESPALVERELEQHRIKCLEEIFIAHSNVYVTELQPGEPIMGRRITDYKWCAMAAEIIKLFKNKQ